MTRYSVGSETIIDNIFNDYNYEIAICNSVTPPTNLSQLLLSEEPTLRATATYTTTPPDTILIEAVHDTNGLGATYNPTFCVVVLKNGPTDLEVLSVEPFVQGIDPASSLTTSHTYTVTFTV